MLAAVLLTENSQYTIAEQAQTFLVLLAVLAVTYVLMVVSSGINRLIGSSGASVVSRVMGLILASVAMANLLEGITQYFELG